MRYTKKHGRVQMSKPWIWLALLLTVPSLGFALTCPKLEKDLARLRQEYREFVSSPKKDGNTLSFEEIASRLDKIVEIKNEMRKKGCKIPPRPKPWESK